MDNSTSNLKKVLVPVLSVLLGFLLGAIIMWVSGYDAIAGYKTMINTAFINPQTGAINPKSIGEIFVTAGPLIFTGLGFAVANTAGFFNIGLSGQALCGWVASVWTVLAMQGMPKLVVVPVAVIVGALAGAVAAAIPGALRAFFGTSEVIVTIMMNYILLYVSTHIVNNVMSESIIQTKGVTKNVGLEGSLRTEWLGQISNGSRLNLGIILAIVFLVLVWFLLKKTTLGLEIRSVGLNPFASEYAGMSSKRTIIISMVISGALAGLGGVVQGLGTFNNFFVQGSSLSIGFDGMAVSLLGSGTSVGILISALLFSVLKLGGQGMQFAGIPPELVDVVIASIIFFIGISFIIKLVIDKVIKDKKAETIDLKPTPSNENNEGGTI
ncbi:ABC transporter permease [Vagococcus xieshaowenii]|uniref:ABC transporter permease n=1 Tax=Vagococcus xieshaowenii TaxID=2562451 RepID=A0AAJ5EGV1_9ENTE|nr:ABC transporter permease [Vagococcus xieshaowenii]QCA29538.1 ABC transporter permease [Vagococcus xieshaowenii]TFZ42654.1 ABC transporter permease [Vagococcus xieshaowenii]